MTDFVNDSADDIVSEWLRLPATAFFTVAHDDNSLLARWVRGQEPFNPNVSQEDSHGS